MSVQKTSEEALRDENSRLQQWHTEVTARELQLRQQLTEREGQLEAAAPVKSERCLPLPYRVW